ncbi:MAG: SpoIID/LytB domain-containing protein [Sporomusaceae bacterium]|nr:SpoIID/LytB domain-containing protein [Sporomusaceae bacterium]
MSKTVYYNEPQIRRIILKHIFSCIVLTIALFINFPNPSIQANPVESTIRVGILSNQQNISVSADAHIQILNAATGELVARLRAGEKGTITVSKNRISINGKQAAAVKLNLLVLKNDGEHSIEINKKKYRGSIGIHMTHGKTGLTVVNTLPIEQYLYGVIAKEISPKWPLEAVKAQAVAARSYALYNLNKHQVDEYDVCVTTDCQVYGGQDSEAPEVIKAVDDTSGQVIMAQGKIIPAYFHSSSGGYTENSENVWGTYQSYLRGVVDYDHNSPQFKWEKRLTTYELQEAINKAGYKIGTLKTIELVPLTSQPMSTVERGVSGRVKVIRFIGSTGSAQLTGEKMRKILQLKSTLFDISIMRPAKEVVEFDTNVPPQYKRGFSTDKKGIHSATGRQGEIIIITGFGFGHGLGLSQWGAKAMAEKGPKGDTTYFKEILKHYYQGTAIKKVF